MQHLWQAACRHGKEADAANVPKKRWQEVFGGWVVKDGVSLAVRRRLAGLHQVATTSSTPSTTVERMRLLLTQLQEDPQGEIPLSHHTLLMLQSAGCTADEGWYAEHCCSCLCRLECPWCTVSEPNNFQAKISVRVTDPWFTTFVSQHKVAGRWGALSKMVSVAGGSAIDAAASMEARGIWIELGACSRKQRL